MRYYVESGYGFCDRFGWPCATAEEAYKYARKDMDARMNVLVQKDGKPITIDQLYRDVLAELNLASKASKE